MILHEIEIYKKYFLIEYFIDESMAPIYHFTDKNYCQKCKRDINIDTILETNLK